MLKNKIEELGEEKYFYLTQNNLSGEDMKTLAEALKNSQVTNLNLSDNSIESDAFKYLADVLKYMQIIDLDLKNNNLRDEGIKYLASVLSDTKIQKLNIAGNSINLENDYSLPEALRHSQITHLDLSDNNIGCKGLKSLANILKDTQIINLNLSNNKFLDESVKYLAKVLCDTKIESLDLEKNKICFETAEYLNMLIADTAIKDLYLDVYYGENSSDRISQRSYDNFKNVYISVHNNSIGIAGSKYLNRSFSKIGIGQVTFYSSSLNQNDVPYLAQAFENVNISKLSLPSNYITKSCIDQLIQIFTKSIIGELASCKLSDSQIQYVAEFLKKIKNFGLNINKNRRLENESIKLLMSAIENSWIMDLDLAWTDIDSEKSKYLSEILRDSKILWINLCHCDIQTEGAKYLANGLRHSQVTHIHMHGNWIKDEGYQALVNVVDDTNISWVNLHDNGITDMISGLSNISPYRIPRNTVTIAHKIKNTFEQIVSLSDSGEFEFIVFKKENHCYNSSDIDKYPFLIGTLKNNPNSIVHIIYNTCKNNRDVYDFDRIEKIENFVANITSKFISFVESKLPEFLNEFVCNDYVNLIKQFEDLKFDDIVQNLLLHRVLYYVDDNQEILHPYIYKLLNKYNLPLYNSELEPNKKNEIILYYENHREIDGVREIIDLLKSNLL